MEVLLRRLAPVLVLVLLVTGWAMSDDGDGEVSGPALRKSTSEMILVPGGEFAMGSDTDGDHSPAHPVRLQPFYIGKYEVTNAEYLEFCQATGHRLPEFWGEDIRRSGSGFPNHPVMGISWQDAADYAEWRGMRLPTEAEWEYVARGGRTGLNYPTADALSPDDANYAASLGGPVEVGSYPPNGLGVYDMSGNVFEWVADWYDGAYYAHSPTEDPGGPESGKHRVIRGGSWHSGPFCLRTYYRNGLPPQWVDFGVGIRLAKDADTPIPSEDLTASMERDNP
jgi:formylglycine-generating enzyme required for sulfatase activity